METDILVGFVIGVGVGATAALLLAPASGGETRQRIRKKADEGTQFLKERASSVKESAGDLVDKGKATLGGVKETIVEASEAGRQAYLDEINS